MRLYVTLLFIRESEIVFLVQLLIASRTWSFLRGNSSLLHQLIHEKSKKLYENYIYIIRIFV